MSVHCLLNIWKGATRIHSQTLQTYFLTDWLIWMLLLLAVRCVAFVATSRTVRVQDSQGFYDWPSGGL